MEHEHSWLDNENEVRAPLPVKREVLYDSGMLYGYVIPVLLEARNPLLFQVIVIDFFLFFLSLCALPRAYII